ncbi:MAG: alpha-glucuronidase family glycosyl hydrolase, partial [Sphingobium sp.]
MIGRLLCCIISSLCLTLPSTAMAEDGYRLWLRYARMEGAALNALATHATAVVAPGKSDTVAAAQGELVRALGEMTGQSPALSNTLQTGAIWLATPASAPS